MERIERGMEETDLFSHPHQHYPDHHIVGCFYSIGLSVRLNGNHPEADGSD